MAGKTDFTGLERYQLIGIKVTDRELGHGSYATVQELEYVGLKCAGKKIHDLLLEQGDDSYYTRRFEEECLLLSQVRHPNIIQFLGVHFQPGVQVPILVMEFLPTNLTSCIEQYGILPKEISYSILHDVALGLCYLHSQTPPIIHRDLSSNNVLLTSNMTAKISDLGVAKMLNLTPLQVSRLTQTPGTPAYMPPEVMIDNPKYDMSVDEFSYGILMIHMLSGRWPAPQVGQNQIEEGKLVPVTEAERREVFLRAIGNEHPLMGLIMQCINNDPRHRARASEIVERVHVAAMTLQYPASFANRLDMLRHIEHQEEEKLTLNKEKEAIKEEREAEKRRNEQKVSGLKEEALEKSGEIVRLNIAHSSEVEVLRLQVRDLKSQNQLLTDQQEADEREWKAKASSYEAQIYSNDKILKKERDDFEIVRAGEQEVFQMQISSLEARISRQREELKKQKEDSEIQLARERESHVQLTKEITQTKNSLQHELLVLKAESSRKDSTIQRKSTELEAQNRVIEEKNTSISGIREQLTRTREYLMSKQQVLQADVTWKHCAKLPVELTAGKCTLIDNKVYCGGGFYSENVDERVVYCYEPSGDNWTTLPLLPVRWFGLGQVNGQLVAVGGRKGVVWTDKVYTYDEQLEEWKLEIPEMPTARHFVGVLSLESALIVAGGATQCTSNVAYTDAVEIFKPDTSQWYTTDPLPTACCRVSLTTIGSTCYAFGGYKQPSYLNQAIYASVDDLLHNAVPADQATPTGSGDAQSAWRTLPDTPAYGPTAAVLHGQLLTVGGQETEKGGADKKEVYRYSPSSNSWIYISDLPAPRSNSAVAVLSYTEILVIGGCCASGQVNAVYKGTLQLKL